MRIEEDQIDFAVNGGCEADQALSVLQRIIHPTEHDILKEHMPPSAWAYRGVPGI